MQSNLQLLIKTDNEEKIIYAKDQLIVKITVDQFLNFSAKIYNKTMLN